MTRDPEQFARDVASSMTRMRGWAPGSAPREVIDDVFDSMTRHEALYVAGFEAGDDPAEVARRVQWAEWNAPRES